MGALEDDEIVATKLVSDQLVERAQYIGDLLREGNRHVLGYLQETIIWVFVSRAVLESLAVAASHRSLSSANELVALQARIKTILSNIEVPHPETDADADKAQRVLFQRRRETKRTSPFRTKQTALKAIPLRFKYSIRI